MTGQRRFSTRVALRWIHIFLGLIVMCYIYSPFHQNTGFQIIMKFIVIPVIALTGIWLWKFKEFNKLLRIKSE